MSALLSFLGGSAFRLIWGQITDFLNKRQDHKYELERMALQSKMDAEQHARNLEAIRIQHEMGVEVVRVQGEAVVAKAELDGWAQAVANATRPSGIWLVDLLNGMVRPVAAGIAIFLWVAALNSQGYQMTEWDKELVGVILGFYFATRLRETKR